MLLILAVIFVALSAASAFLFLAELAPGRQSTIAARLTDADGLDPQARETIKRRGRQVRSEKVAALLQALGEQVQGRHADVSALRLRMIQAGYTGGTAVPIYLGSRIALPIGLLAAWLIGRYLRRPRPEPPPPPPRPPWEVALEELFDVRHAGLVAEGRLAEHFDRVSDIVRKYLGARFGFDGLESTTREVLYVLRRVSPPLEPLDSIETFLRQADLVKFAKTVPSAEDCELALTRAERIISTTLPEARASAGAALRPEPEPGEAT